MRIKTLIRNAMSIYNRYSHKVFEVYVQQRAPAAYRIFWYYGPGGEKITIVAIQSHP